MENKVYDPKFYNLVSMKGKSGIYQIRNIKNNKLYIGSSNDLYKRKSDHFYELRSNIHRNEHLQNAFNIYGEKNFIFEIIEFCDIKDKLKIEQYWIDRLEVLNRDKGYNINPKTNGSNMSEETKTKISMSRIGLKNPMHNKFGSKHHNHKKIVCLEELTIYNGFHTIERLKNISGTHICACCRHKDGRKIAGGFHWFYYDEFIKIYPELISKLVYCNID